MPEAPPRDAPGSARSLRGLVAAFLSNAASRQSPQPPDLGFLDSITEEEEKVLKKHWPDATPEGDGVDHLSRRMEMLDNRARWRARIATGNEIVWLAGKAAGVVIAFGFLWGHVT